jgi:hypothetical protein
LGTSVKVKVTPTITSRPSAATSTVTPLVDPLGRYPTATPPGGGGQAAGSSLLPPNLSTPGKGEKPTLHKYGGPLSSTNHGHTCFVAWRSQVLKCETLGNVPSRGANTSQHDEHRRPRADIIHCLEVTL